MTDFPPLGPDDADNIGIHVVDVRGFALILTIDSRGCADVTSPAGVSRRGCAALLRLVAADLDQLADQQGDPALTDDEQPRRKP